MPTYTSKRNLWKNNGAGQESCERSPDLRPKQTGEGGELELRSSTMNSRWCTQDASVTLNKPMSVGFSILDLSKLIMYEFYYDHLKPKYDDKCTLLFTDTASFCCHIETKDLHSDMAQNIDIFDTSNFDKNHPLYTT